MSVICPPILSVAFAVCVASFFTSLGDHGKATAGFAGARGLDGGVQRQQVGLLGHRGDQLDDVADPPRGLRKAAMLPSVCGPAGRLSSSIRLDSFGLPADLLYRRADFLGRGRHRLDVVGHRLAWPRPWPSPTLSDRHVRRLGQRAGGGLELGRRLATTSSPCSPTIVSNSRVIASTRWPRCDLCLGLGSGGFVRGLLGDQRILEHLQRVRHLADLGLLAPVRDGRCRGRLGQARAWAR